MNLAKVSVLLIILLSFGCSNDNYSEYGWNEINRTKKTVDNITYYFSSEISMQRRELAILECQNSVIDNLKLIEEKEFTNKMDVEFLASRDEMLKYGGMSAQGLAYPDRNTFFTLLKDEGSPIKHEMMHMITMYKWGTPPPSSTWMNEGLATYAGGTCSEYSLEEIYKYFIQSGKLIPLDDLAANFYGNPEMIAYTQSAFISKYLIDNYGIDKFKLLWKKGVSGIAEIYDFNSEELQTRLDDIINSKYPEDIDFDWEEYEKGC